MTACDRILVTGGAGFIGSAVLRQYIARTNSKVINLDKLTYAGSPESLGGARHDSRYTFYHADIGDRKKLEGIFREERPTAIMHLAAESHVDRSINGPDAFIRTNIVGTYTLLQVASAYWNELSTADRVSFRFHHVSTDEVFGDLGSDAPPFTEESPYAPNSPYAASKASSDHLVRAWSRTYGLPVVLTNCSNNYGPYQYPEKLIPIVILNALDGKALPIYGTGENIRDWLYVEDHAEALRLVLAGGTAGRCYNIGGQSERANVEVVQHVCSVLDRLAPHRDGSYTRLMQFVTDRPGHDRRYAIDDGRVRRELGWCPRETFETGLEKTVRWYLANREWADRVRKEAYHQWLQVNYGNR